jgi:hypothetical protein
LQSSRLPELSIVGPAVQMRKRDYLLFLADFLPAGFRRRHKGDLLEHPWEPRRMCRVWWHDIGWQALRGGFRGRIVTGALQVLSWKSVLAMRDRGWLSRRRRPVGLIYQDDVLMASFLSPRSDIRCAICKKSCRPGRPKCSWRRRRPQKRFAAAVSI